MQIQINTDRNVVGHEARVEKVTGIVNRALGRFTDHVTRIEVHLSDVNSLAKGGSDDHRCVMEARMHGRAPIAVTHNAANVAQAAEGAAQKLAKKMDSTLGRLRDQRTRATTPPSSPDPEIPSD